MEGTTKGKKRKRRDVSEEEVGRPYCQHRSVAACKGPAGGDIVGSRVDVWFPLSAVLEAKALPIDLFCGRFWL